MNTLSVGSPDTEVLELLEGDDLGFQNTSGSRRDSKLGQAYSPMQQGFYPSVPTQQSQMMQQAVPSPNTQARYPAKPQGSTITPSSAHYIAPSQAVPAMATATGAAIGVTQQPFMNARHGASPTYHPSFAATHQMPTGMTPPQLGMHGNPAAMGVMPAAPGMGDTGGYDQSLIELQLQNLQAMQQQWLQMMQMQMDQTLYATQQRLQSMQIGTGTTPPNVGGFVPKANKFPVGPSYDSVYMGHPQPQANPYGGPSVVSAQQPPGGGQSVRSPPAQRSHRRHHNDRTAGGGVGNATSNSNNTEGTSNGHSGAGGHAASSLLADHKVTGRRLTAQELAGHVVEFSRDSHGSRLVQFKMETGTPDERRAFVAEALPHTLSLAKDLFGNYVIQNFFDNAAPDQRDMLAIALMGNVSSLCTHAHGCRVIQRALFAVSPARRNDLIEELLDLQTTNSSQTESIIRSCARDAHATHVLQKAVVCLQKAVGLKGSFKDAIATEETMDPPKERARAQRTLDKIESFVLADCIPMSTHQQACRVVQRVLGACEPGKTSPRVDQILQEVFRNIDALAIHQNGNFVLQHLLEAGEPGLAAKVQAYVCTHAVRLARHKFGSHLVEKSLSCATPSQVNAIVDRILSPLTREMLDDVKDDFETSYAEDVASGLTPSPLPILMKDPYANFVVQKAFDVSRGEVRARLSQAIRARTATLSKFSYGRHILTHINRAGSGAGEAPQ